VLLARPLKFVSTFYVILNREICRLVALHVRITINVTKTSPVGFAMELVVIVHINVVSHVTITMLASPQLMDARSVPMDAA